MQKIEYWVWKPVPSKMWKAHLFSITANFRTRNVLKIQREKIKLVYIVFAIQPIRTLACCLSKQKWFQRSFLRSHRIFPSTKLEEISLLSSLLLFPSVGDCANKAPATWYSLLWTPFTTCPWSKRNGQRGSGRRRRRRRGRERHSKIGNLRAWASMQGRQ